MRDAPGEALYELGTPLPPSAKFCLECAHPVDGGSGGPVPAPESYIPRHLAEKILTSRAAIEGERKQVTGLFAGLKGSTELLGDRDPEEPRALLDPPPSYDGRHAPVRRHGESRHG